MKQTKQAIITEETRMCYMCKQISKHKKISNIQDVYMDNLPKENTIDYVLQKFELCPHCGYVMDNIERTPSLDERLNTTKARDNKEYLETFQSERIPYEEKLLLLEHMRQERYNFVDGIKFAMAVYYEYQNDNFKFKKYMNEHIKVIEKKIALQRAKLGMIQQDAFLLSAIEHYYTLIECNRRVGNFSKAIEHIDKFEKIKLTKETKHFKQLFKEQRKMCVKGISDRR